MITIERKALLEALSKVLPATDSRSAHQYCKTVHLTDMGVKLLVEATNLTTSARTEVDATIKGEVDVAVNCKELLERVKAMPDGELRLKVDDGFRVTLQSKVTKRKFVLFGLPGSDFPPVPTPHTDDFIADVDAATLASAIRKTSSCASGDESRPHVNAVMLRFHGDNATAVATDGHRLTLVGSDADGGREALVPLGSAFAILRALEKAENTVEVSASKVDLFVCEGATRVSARLIDATFPPYRQVIPQLSKAVAVAPKAALADALKSVGLAASEKTSGVKLTVSGGGITVSSETPEAGAGYDEVPVEYSGPEVTVGINAGYMAHALTCCDTDDVELHVAGELDPVLILPHGSGDVRAVVMPMRI